MLQLLIVAILTTHLHTVCCFEPSVAVQSFHAVPPSRHRFSLDSPAYWYRVIAVPLAIALVALILLSIAIAYRCIGNRRHSTARSISSGAWMLLLLLLILGLIQFSFLSHHWMSKGLSGTSGFLFELALLLEAMLTQAAMVAMHSTAISSQLTSSDTAGCGYQLRLRLGDNAIDRLQRTLFVVNSTVETTLSPVRSLSTELMYIAHIVQGPVAIGKDALIFSVYALAVLIALLGGGCVLSYADATRTKTSFDAATAGVATFAALLIIALFAEMSVTIAQADFCSAPSDTLVNMLRGRSSTQAVVRFYTGEGCAAGGYVISPSLVAAVQSAVDPISSSLQALCPEAVSTHVSEATSGLQNLTALAACGNVHPLWLRGIHHTCGEAFNGLYSLWVLHLVLAGLLFTLLLLLVAVTRVHIPIANYETPTDGTGGGRERRPVSCAL